MATKGATFLQRGIAKSCMADSVGMSDGNGVAINMHDHQQQQQLSESERIYQQTVGELQKVYRKKIRPLEKEYYFEKFHSEPLTDQDISARPMILLLGQYSTGKTTFMEYFLGHRYPGAHIGIEPTTDRFVAVMYNNNNQVIPGNTAAVSNELPFKGLNQFGEKFLSRFQVSQMRNSLLQNLTFIDSPGILSGTKQINRGYDFGRVIRWFVERSDLVLLLFDSHKLDISDEFKLAIRTLAGHEDKVRIVLNKCDQISQQELMRVYGALMWSLGRVISTPEVIRVYMGSFWPATHPPLKHTYEEARELFDREQRDLLVDMRLIPKNAAIRRLNEIVKRTRQAMVHAYICGYIRSQLPTFGSKEKKLKSIMDDLDAHFTKIQHMYNLAQGDFPDAAAFKHNCQYFKAKEFPKMDISLINAAKDALNNDFPRLMRQFPSTARWTEINFGETYEGQQQQQQQQALPAYSALTKLEQRTNVHNPFTNGTIPSGERRYQREFFAAVDPATGMVAGTSAGEQMTQRWGLDNRVMAEIWDCVDWRGDGKLDAVQFEAAMRMCEEVHDNGLAPEQARYRVFDELGLQIG